VPGARWCSGRLNGATGCGPERDCRDIQACRRQATEAVMPNTKNSSRSILTPHAYILPSFTMMWLMGSKNALPRSLDCDGAISAPGFGAKIRDGLSEEAAGRNSNKCRLLIVHLLAHPEHRPLCCHMLSAAARSEIQRAIKLKCRSRGQRPTTLGLALP
jgi:hypothetical protein